MKKSFLVFLAAVLFMACSDDKKGEPAKNTDLIQQNLKGKVQHYEETSSTIDSTGASKTDSVMIATDFDEKGYQTKYTTKDNAGKVKEEQTFTRYDGGQAKEVIVKNGDGKQTLKWEITIDSSGKYNGAKVYDSTGKVSSIWKELSENEFGEVTGGTEYKADNTMKSSFISNYDKDGHYTGGSGKDSTGKETFHSTVKLNDKGDAAEETTMTVVKDSTKNEMVTYKYDSYDEKGNWTQRTTYNNKGKSTKTVKRTYAYYKE